MNIISIQNYYDNVIVEVIKESIIGTKHKLKWTLKETIMHFN